MGNFCLFGDGSIIARKSYSNSKKSSHILVDNLDSGQKTLIDIGFIERVIGAFLKKMESVK